MSKIMFLGRPLTFGDVEQIKELKRLIKDSEEKEYFPMMRKPSRSRKRKKPNWNVDLTNLPIPKSFLKGERDGKYKPRKRWGSVTEC